ncbi:MAG: efflux RND transporter periplasmic adaptor subunit [bacterium]
MWMRLFILILLFISVGFGCGKKEKVETATPESKPSEERVIHLNAEKQKLIGLETLSLQKKKLFRPIFATGKAIQDPQQMEFVFSPSAGTLTKIIAPVGSWVQRGAPLVQVNGGAVRSSKSGTVISINALPGQKIDRMIPVATVANTNPIRVIFDVFPQDMDRVRVGQKVDVNLIGHEEEIFPGRVVYLSPNLDDSSQSMKVGVEVENLGSHIKYGMFVHGKILEPISESALVIPEGALARFDQDYAVFVMKGSEEFEKRPVKVGIRGKDEVEIAGGLQEGEKIVTQGTFQLKSESQSHLLKDED